MCVCTSCILLAVLSIVTLCFLETWWFLHVHQSIRKHHITPDHALALDRQKGPSRDTKGGQLLCETIAVGAIETSVDVREQFVQGVVQFDLVLWRLGVEQVVLVRFETRFACQNETQHRAHHSPMVGRWSKKEQVEESRHQTRKQIWMSGQVLQRRENSTTM